MSLYNDVKYVKFYKLFFYLLIICSQVPAAVVMVWLSTSLNAFLGIFLFFILYFAFWIMNFKVHYGDLIINPVFLLVSLIRLIVADYNPNNPDDFIILFCWICFVAAWVFYFAVCVCYLLAYKENKKPKVI